MKAGTKSFFFCVVYSLSDWIKISADDNLKYFSYFSQETGFDISCKLSLMETICIKCQILFSGKNKKNFINLSSAELAQRVVKVKAPDGRDIKIAYCLFVLRFYGPVNPMGSCRARSVYLTTRLLGRLSPLSG